MSSINRWSTLYKNELKLSIRCSFTDHTVDIARLYGRQSSCGKIGKEIATAEMSVQKTARGDILVFVDADATVGIRFSSLPSGNFQS